MSRQELMWGMSVPYLKISAQDASRVIYLSEKQAKKWKASGKSKSGKVYDDPNAFMNDLGLPIFN